MVEGRWLSGSEMVWDLILSLRHEMSLRGTQVLSALTDFSFILSHLPMRFCGVITRDFELHAVISASDIFVLFTRDYRLAQSVS